MSFSLFSSSYHLQERQAVTMKTIGHVAMVLVMTVSAGLVAAQDFDFNACMNLYNQVCNFVCPNNLRNCYVYNWQRVCPCIVQCHQSHCMEGHMAQTCPGCGIHISYCKPWHDHIELHSCGDKKFDNKTSLHNHCQSLDTCVQSCPLAAQCVAADVYAGIMPAGVMPDF